MEVTYWWMPLAWLVVIALAVLVFVRVRRSRSVDLADSVPIAHSDRLTALPAYRSAIARYRMALALAAAAAIALLLASIALTSRFSTLSVTQPDLENRDIVLCLDISGSMIDYDEKVLEVFSDLATEFTGERISLVVFNASAVTYFPLTSDYDYITAQFERLNADFADDEGAYYRGTLIGDGSSLVGDGLASCATRFDPSAEGRSESIILVTDNLVVGNQLFSLPEAGALAADLGIRVYGVNPGDTTARDYLAEFAAEFEAVVAETGGAYYPLDDPAAIPSIVASITSEQASVIGGPLQLERRDEPAPFVWLAGLALAALFLAAWRLRL